MTITGMQWRVVRTTSFRELHGRDVTVTYDDAGIGISAMDVDAALTIPWGRCRPRLARRSSTWELRLSGTPWGDLTLSTFRPTLTHQDVAEWESRGVLWTRWRWSRAATVTLVASVVAFVGLSVVLAKNDVRAIVQRPLPALRDVPFPAVIDTTNGPLTRILLFPHDVATPHSDDLGPFFALTGPLQRQHVACTGLAPSRDRIFGRAGATPVAVGFSSLFRSTDDRSFVVGVTSELFARPSDVAREQDQLIRPGMAPCVATTFAKMVFRDRKNFGDVVFAEPLAANYVSRAEVSSSHAVIEWQSRRYEFFVAQISYQRYRVTVTGYGTSRESDENLFRQLVSTVTHSLTNERAAAV